MKGLEIAGALLKRPQALVPFRLQTQSTVEKTVYISTSNDIYANLALEDWFYNHLNTERLHALMLWRNSPCVVIGKFQNPWLEANISALKSIGGGVAFARRSSGGGTVYHDMGNVNLTFFTAKKDYNRRENLTFIKRVLEKHFNIRAEINKRDDLIVNDSKISGTAAKLGRLTVYHHCTILVDVNKQNLHAALDINQIDIETNASKSVKSHILNLSDISDSITAETLLTAFATEYSDNVQILTPNEQQFPGLIATKDTFRSWDWRFGKTPKFTINRTFKVPLLLEGTSCYNKELHISLLVEQGRISDINLTLPLGLVQSNSEFDHNFAVINDLKGQKYSEDVLANLRTFLTHEESSKFVLECFRKTVQNHA